MDSCFTGGADGKSAFKGATAATILVPRSIESRFGKRMAVLTAGGPDQYSTAIEEKGHRVFSYYLIKALLANYRDFDKLAQKVSADVFDYTKDRGEFEQTPVSSGNQSLRL